MNLETPQINLWFAWAGILLGFVSGLILGLNFHRENWLGGYSSFKRRLYRLAHISFFGLGAVNLLFYLTVRGTDTISTAMLVASRAFILGAIFMPICCVAMAHFPCTRLLFGLPVLSLILGGLATLTFLASNHPGRHSVQPPLPAHPAGSREGAKPAKLFVQGLNFQAPITNL